MKNNISLVQESAGTSYKLMLYNAENDVYPAISQGKNKFVIIPEPIVDVAEILLISSYPPRECGIATYSQDLITALNKKFSKCFSVKICALETGDGTYQYPEGVKYILNTSIVTDYEKLAFKINRNVNIKIVLIQHEFGLYHEQEMAFLKFLYELSKPVVIVFHTVLSHPDPLLMAKVKRIASVCTSIIVMTRRSAEILTNEYNVPQQKISVIAHGTHLVSHLSEKILKQKYGLSNRKVLSTFGLLSSGKGIETTIDALPDIVRQCPEVLFLVLGKTHPEVVRCDGEVYREMLEKKVEEYGLQDNVRFVNRYLALPELLEYLQLTDIYLFTANDPNQAVSGTFVYAMSCACPIISTPIPHALEILKEDTGLIFDFRNSGQLADSVIRLLTDEPLRRNISNNTLQNIVSSAWENSAISHAMLFAKMAPDNISIYYNLPPVNLSHMKEMTTETGIIQFSKINHPDIESGYTLDDNARALISMCMYFQITGEEKSLYYIQKYLDFIQYCQQTEGNFLNYVDKEEHFSPKNDQVNLDDANGRAVWALGYLISQINVLPANTILKANRIIDRAFPTIEKTYSTRAMAFNIKGLYNYHQTIKMPENLVRVKTLADRLVKMYQHESSPEWQWFEGYLTYANSILPESLLLAWLLIRDPAYKEIALESFNFLLKQTFNKNGIEVISNKQWLQKGQEPARFGEQPIDVAYTILTLSKFYDVFMDEVYRLKMETAFNWFLGNNRLHQIIYNPCTGGCYDGLEESNVNLNQGAESTVSYLMARLTIERYKDQI